MGILKRLFGSDDGGAGEHNPEAVAQGIVGRYQQRRARGDLRVDDQLYCELCQVLPGNAAQEVFNRFRTRRSRPDPKAEYLLLMEIGVAIHDAQHYAEKFGPKVVRKPAEPDRTPPSAAKTYAKAIDGRPLTGADEDAVLFRDLLNGD